MQAIQTLVMTCEKALKLVSDHLVERLDNFEFNEVNYSSKVVGLRTYYGSINSFKYLLIFAPSLHCCLKFSEPASNTTDDATEPSSNEAK